MKIKFHKQENCVRLEASIAGLLSLDTKQESEEECIKSLLQEVLLIAKYNPSFIDTLLKDTSNEND